MIIQISRRISGNNTGHSNDELVIFLATRMSRLYVVVVSVLHS